MKLDRIQGLRLIREGRGHELKRAIERDLFRRGLAYFDGRQWVLTITGQKKIKQ